MKDNLTQFLEELDIKSTKDDDFIEWLKHIKNIHLPAVENNHQRYMNLINKTRL